jgi:hypothetical protein
MKALLKKIPLFWPQGANQMVAKAAVRDSRVRSNPLTHGALTVDHRPLQ